MSPVPVPRRSSARWWLAAASVLFWCGVLEVSIRAWRRSHAGPTTHPGLIEEDPELGWRLRPRASYRQRSTDFDVQLRTNAEGFRDAEGEEGAEAIWLFGDSLAFGWGVEVEHSLADRLERNLGVVVRNFSVSGYGTDQEYLGFRAGLRRFRRPLGVVVVCCENDVVEVTRSRMYGAPKPRFLLDETGELIQSERSTRRSLLEDHSALVRFLKKRFEAPAIPTDRELTEGSAVMAALFNRWAEDCDQGGVEFLVVATGEHTAGLAGTLPEPQFLDVRPALEIAGEEQAVIFENDAHWNESGHRVVAARIAEVLRGRWDLDDTSERGEGR